MMQSQISFYPDRNFHAMKIWKKTLHAPTYPRHADTNFGEKKNASGRRESAPQLHDWKKIWVILKPQNFHGSENFLEMILPLHISLEVLYWSPYRFSYTNEGNRVNFAMAANGAPGFISTLIKIR